MLIDIGTRTDFSLEGLQCLINEVFTDNDANGENGEEYYIKDSNGTLRTFNDILKDKVADWFNQGRTETEIVVAAFEEYYRYGGSYYRHIDYKCCYEGEHVSTLVMAAVA